MSRVGQPPDPQKYNADLKTLMQTNWFSDVQVFCDESPPKSRKLILTFSVREMPVLSHVEFRGAKAIRKKELEDTTGLKVGPAPTPATPRRRWGRSSASTRTRATTWPRSPCSRGARPARPRS